VQANLEALNTFFLVMSLVLGCMVGSFLNVCIYRIPRGESIVRPRSKCPKCGNGIAWYDNFPIVSWLVLGAKCRYCGQPISWQYPLVESITGVFFACVYLRFHMTVATPVYMFLAAGLIMVTFVDLTDWTIPDEVTLPGIPLGILCGLIGMFVPSTGFIVHDVFDALIGAALGGGVLYSLDKLTFLLAKKRGMGFGDVKLLAMLGAFLGWKSVIVIIMLASFIGSIAGLLLIVVNRRLGPQTEDAPQGGHYLPFGPYLALGGVLYLFFGEWMISAYMNMLHAPETGGVLLQ
jgi:leader peptidase (prepilin peptidase)/N-methyltransferase